MVAGASRSRWAQRGRAAIELFREARGKAVRRGSGESIPRRARIHLWLRRLVLAFCLLALGGVLASYTTTVYYNITVGLPLFDDFLKHISYLLFGLVLTGLMVVLIDRITPARRWLKYVIPVTFYVSLALVALVLVPGLGREVNGARRFLDIGVVVFQPSELLKVAIVLYLGQLLCWWRKPAPVADADRELDASWDATAGSSLPSGLRRLFAQRNGRPSWPELPRRAVFIVAAAILVTVIQPDLGSSFIILCVSFVTLVLAGVDWRHVVAWGLVLVLTGALALGVLALAAPQKVQYIPGRLNTYAASVLSPGPDEDNTGYQLAQARGALAAGGWTGVGYLNGTQKLNRLPFATNDFVFPVLVEELGYIGGVVVILLFLNLAYAGMRLANCCRDPFNKTVIAALGFALCLQGFFHIGVTTGAFPLSGLTLPFFSAGGTSLVASTLAVGLMFALALSETRGKGVGAKAQGGMELRSTKW